MLDYFKTSILFMNCSHLVTKWSLRDMKIDLIFHPEFLLKCHITAKDGHKKKMQQKLHSAQWFNFHFINKTDMKKSEKIAQTEISAPKNSIQIALFFLSATMAATLSTSMSAAMSANMSATAMLSRRFVRSQRR